MSGNQERVFLKGYTQPSFNVARIELRFELDPERTIVTSTMQFGRRTGISPSEPLILNGPSRCLREVRLNGQALDAALYHCADDQMVVYRVPAESFELQVVTEIAPAKNTTLEGLYFSQGMFCTQCEPHGFRAMTFFLDRPDVMTTYRTTVVANRERFPVLLSNGNLVEEFSLPDGRHGAVWDDPFKKPSYLFALVAGDLAMVEDSFTRRSGRPVTLRIFTNKGSERRVGHAMACLKKAMAWDEARFGREYDLDIFMIAAIDAFNFGGMENKGLNIFNSRALIGDHETATDERLSSIDAVVAHEYFHNWTGDRITCRDWFQLTLKEGLTVLREQLYMEEQTSFGDSRIRYVDDLRDKQFSEDSGALPHPIQPKSFVEINNFYTSTIYDKGAEVIRMMRTVIGREAFRRGMDMYFERHDGKAVTTEEFVLSIEAGSGVDLSAYRLWYSQSGTPEVHVTRRYDPKERAFELTLEQRHPHGKFFAFDGSIEEPRALPIPLRLGLLTRSGKEIPLKLKGQTKSYPEDTATSKLVELTESSTRVVFGDLSEEPVVALNRGFSAPVRIVDERSFDDLPALLAYEPDPVCRWEAGQRLYSQTICEMVRNPSRHELRATTIDAVGALLQADIAADLKALYLRMPEESVLLEEFALYPIREVYEARNALTAAVAVRYRDILQGMYDRCWQQSAGDGHDAVGNRRLAQVALQFLFAAPDSTTYALAEARFKRARCLSEQLGALVLVMDSAYEKRDEILNTFYQRWRDEGVVIPSWFSAIAGSTMPDTLDRAERAARDPAFVITNPNRVYALYRRFADNLLMFHRNDGRGYRFVAEAIREIDRLNPLVAAELSKRFSAMRRLAPDIRAKALATVNELLAIATLSKNSREVLEAAVASVSQPT